METQDTEDYKLEYASRLFYFNGFAVIPLPFSSVSVYFFLFSVTEIKRIFILTFIVSLKQKNTPRKNRILNIFGMLEAAGEVITLLLIFLTFQTALYVRRN